MTDYIQVAKELAKKFAGMDISGGGLGKQVADQIFKFSLSNFRDNGALKQILKLLNLQQDKMMPVGQYISSHKLLQDGKVKSVDSLIDDFINGKGVNALINEALGPVVTVADNTAVSVDTQKRTSNTTTNPKGPLSMPTDVGTYAIDPQDAQKILFFKLTSLMDPFVANLVAFYPESEEVHYKVTDFMANAAERINTVILGMQLGEKYTSLAWVAFAYMAEKSSMPLLRNVLAGEYAGEYWMDAYGHCIYQDEDGISADRFESDYKVFRSMINDYDIPDLIKFASVGDGAEKQTASEMELPPNVLANTQGASESDDSDGKEKTEDNSILNNDSTYSIPTELGMPIDTALDRIKDASTQEVENKRNESYKFTPTEDLQRRLKGFESDPIASQVYYRHEMKSLRDEIKTRLKEDATMSGTGITTELDPAPTDKDIMPDQDRPFAQSGAATDPKAASMAIPTDVGGEINKAIANIDDMTPEEMVDSMLFNMSNAKPEEEDETDDIEKQVESKGYFSYREYKVSISKISESDYTLRAVKNGNKGGIVNSAKTVKEAIIKAKKLVDHFSK